MATLVLRSTKGSALTNAEADANFANLNTEKIERNGTIPMSGALSLAASTTANPSGIIPLGTAAPTTPISGAFWNLGGLIQFRTPSQTKTFAFVEDGVTGFTGSVGATGFTGSVGVAGFTGSRGTTGFAGSAGPVNGAANQVVYKDATNIPSGSNNFRTNGNGVAIGPITPSATVGRLDVSNDVVSFSSSDERLKYNIMEIGNALGKVRTLRGVTFNWKPEFADLHGYDGTPDTGIIAQDVLPVLPEAVITRENGYLAVRYERIIGLLIEAIKTLDAQVQELRAD